MEVTTHKIIDGLYFTIGMMLFNPLTGEGKTPEQLNEDDRKTYDACIGAIEVLRKQEPIEPTTKNKAYFCGNPSCKKIIAQMVPCGAPTHRVKYCSECGKAVKWE